MAKEYLDKDGLTYLWAKIKAYVSSHGGGGGGSSTIDSTYDSATHTVTIIANPIADADDTEY